ncbi:MAG: hypothetical protein ACTHOU_11115, partial [Aureliella sp.]
MSSPMENSGASRRSSEELSKRLDCPAAERIIRACTSSLEPSGSDEAGLSGCFRKPIFSQESFRVRKPLNSE